MFSFFKRRPDDIASARHDGRAHGAARSPASTKGGPSAWQEPVAVPQAQDADWAMWEDSVAFQESQLTEYEPTEPSPISSSEPASEQPHLDPFSAVHKHSG